MMSKEFRCWFLPYCIKIVEQGSYVILNRQYKPLGMVTKECVDYSQHAVKIKMSTTLAKSLSFDNSDDVENVYLYNDACIPTRDKKTYGCLPYEAW